MAALVVALLLAPLALAQDGRTGNGPTIYPDLAGDALALALAATYAPASTYPYDRARDTLFAAVYLERDADGVPTDSLRGLYSGHAVWLDPSLDPTSAAWASSPRFSTEHLWPQSRGATDGTDAHSDMHHLVPVMQSVNSSRSDHPFAEIPDTETDRWWGPDGLTRTTPPPQLRRDLYTEKRNRQVGAASGAGAVLEPREGVAGDVARAMFYVWTVYGPHGADQLDVESWTTQRAVLLDWHAQDPPDQAETDRTLTIARHQGTANPFVLDATLASRAFGPPPEGPGTGPQVALASFTAEQAEGGARVEWRTSAETGTAAFRIDGRADVFGAPWKTWATATASGTPSAYGLDVATLGAGAYRVGLTAIDADGVETTLGDVGLTIEVPTASEDDPATQPFALAAPAPNPSASGTTATLTVPRLVHVLAVVYDALGREAAVVFDRPAVGRVEVRIDTTGLAPGMYVLRAVAIDGSVAQSQRFTVLRR